MRTVNIHSAKTHFSRLIEEVVAGDEIVIAKAGKPVARLSPLATPTKRRLGGLAGVAVVPSDFDAPLPEAVIDVFEGR